MNPCRAQLLDQFHVRAFDRVHAKQHQRRKNGLRNALGKAPSPRLRDRLDHGVHAYNPADTADGVSEKDVRRVGRRIGRIVRNAARGPAGV